MLDEMVLEERPEVDLSVLAASLRAERADTVVFAFDVGTSGVRAGLFDSRGDEIKGSQTSLSREFSALAGGEDADAESLIEFVIRAIDVAVARAESFVSRIDYVAPACFWHSLLGVDDNGRAVTPLLGWADTRAAKAIVAFAFQTCNPAAMRPLGSSAHASAPPQLEPAPAVHPKQ